MMILNGSKFLWLISFIKLIGNLFMVRKTKLTRRLINNSHVDSLRAIFDLKMRNMSYTKYNYTVFFMTRTNS